VTAGDARILLHLLRGARSGVSHRERLQSFYAPQAARYDVFRERLLHGRRELIESIELADGARVVELGGGTGRNLLFFGERLARLGEVSLVDLCPALLEQARQRFTAGYPNVRVVEADATHWQPQEAVDLVYFAYSLSMIPDWRAALANALRMLKPGGVLAVVDFYVSGGQAMPGRVQHGLLTRALWPRWFAHDGVRLGPETPDLLARALPDHDLHECRGRVPYLGGLSVPYFRFVGRPDRGDGLARALRVVMR
jgi:S-adenosylmethionine-diacylgycerolhomoserine-N-methlytransferase